MTRVNSSSSSSSSNNNSNTATAAAVLVVENEVKIYVESMLNFSQSLCFIRHKSCFFLACFCMTIFLFVWLLRALQGCELKFVIAVLLQVVC